MNSSNSNVLCKLATQYTILLTRNVENEQLHMISKTFFVTEHKLCQIINMLLYGIRSDRYNTGVYAVIPSLEVQSLPYSFGMFGNHRMLSVTLNSSIFKHLVFSNSFKLIKVLATVLTSCMMALYNNSFTI